jgi:hypothetical protein
MPEEGMAHYRFEKQTASGSWKKRFRSEQHHSAPIAGRELRRAMGGTIDAWTHEGGGGAFRVCLPLAEE